jgi:hypothetical protein
MPDFHQIIVPIPQSEIEILEAYAVSHEFYREAQIRQEYEQYCQWYEQVAAQHRQEFESLKRDINFLGWFCRGRRS